MLGPMTFAAPVITLKLISDALHVDDTTHGFLLGFFTPANVILLHIINRQLLQVEPTSDM